MNRTRLITMVALALVNAALIVENAVMSKQRDEVLKIVKAQSDKISNLTSLASRIPAVYAMGWDRGAKDLYDLVKYVRDHSGESDNVSNAMARFEVLREQARTNINVIFK